jgi:hypothetical protein
MKLVQAGVLVCLTILMLVPVRAFACNSIWTYYPIWTCVDEPISLGGWIIYSVICFIVWVGFYVDPCPPPCPPQCNY